MLYIQNPHKAVVQIRVHRLHVIKGDGFTQQLLIEGKGKTTIYVVAMEHCHPHYTSHEVKI